MKKLLLFAMLLATVAMTSCSKSSSSASLVGKWKFVSYVSKEGSVTTTNLTGGSADYMDFKSNGTLETFIGGQTGNLAYSISGSNVTFDDITYKFAVSSTTATLTYSEVINGVRYEDVINLRK
jgi:hypothetical protein